MKVLEIKLFSLKRMFIMLISVFLLTLVNVVVFENNEIKSGENDMYIEMYDRQLNHVGNVRDVKYEYTRRVYDFDTSNFSGLCDANITGALIFVLCNEYGDYEYSGFVKNLSQDKKLVKFKGEDFKTIFDTEIALNYTKETFTSPRILENMFAEVISTLEEQIQIMTELIDIEFIIPEDEEDISWIGIHDFEYVVKNAKNFLKPYLAYYDYFIDSKFDRVNKKIVYEIKKTELEEDIKLEDFEFEEKLTDVKTNQTEAVLKWETRNENELVWQLMRGPLEEDPAYTDEYYYVHQYHYEEQGQGKEPEAEPIIEFFNSRSKFVVVLHKYQSPVPIVYYVYQTDFGRIERPDFDRAIYYLGLDNQIYLETIEPENLRIPIKTKIFEEDIIANAQFKAINELVNNRYNENIILTNENCPIDLSTLELNTMVNVYGEAVFEETEYESRQILGETDLIGTETINVPTPSSAENFKITYYDAGEEKTENFITSFYKEINGAGDVFIIRENNNLKITSSLSPEAFFKILKIEAQVLIGSEGETVVKQLPVSEINNNNGLITIKLGFKKTLFTEIIK